MSIKLYVGNISFSVTDEALVERFSECGSVQCAKIITDDGDAARSQGFGFVEMSSDEEAMAAITMLNGSTHNGRPMIVSRAKQVVLRAGDSRRWFH